MRRWLWTFGSGTMFANKYVIVNCDIDDGREMLFQIFGKDNLATSYLLDLEPNVEEEFRRKYGYKKIAVFVINSDCVTVVLDGRPTGAVVLYLNAKGLTDKFKHQIWEEMIGGI